MDSLSSIKTVRTQHLHAHTIPNYPRSPKELFQTIGVADKLLLVPFQIHGKKSILKVFNSICVMKKVGRTLNYRTTLTLTALYFISLSVKYVQEIFIK